MNTISSSQQKNKTRQKIATKQEQAIKETKRALKQTSVIVNEWKSTLSSSQSTHQRVKCKQRHTTIESLHFVLLEKEVGLVVGQHSTQLFHDFETNGRGLRVQMCRPAVSWSKPYSCSP